MNLHNAWNDLLYALIVLVALHRLYLPLLAWRLARTTTGNREARR